MPEVAALGAGGRLLLAPAVVLADLHRLVEDGLVVAGVVHVARGDEVRERADEVPSPDLGGVDAELAGRLVDDLLERPVVHLGAEPPVGALLVLVGQHRTDPVPDAADPVGPDDLGQRVAVVPDAELDVGAVVVDGVDVEAGEDAVAGDPEPDLVVPVGPVVVAVRHVVDAVLEVHDRTADLAGAQAGEDGGLGREELGAETAARRDRHHVQLVGGELQGVRDHEQVAGEAHRVGVDAHRVRRDVVVGDGAHGLQRLPARPAPPHPVGDDDVGRGHVAVDVAEVEAPFEGAVGPQGVVQHGGVVLERGEGVDHRRQLFVLDVDELEGVLGEVAVVGDHDRDALAGVAHLVDRQGTPDVGLRVRAEVGQRVEQLRRPGPGDDGVHPGSAFGLGGVDRGDAGVGHGAAEHRGLEHPGQRHVADVAAPTAQELRVLESPDGLADPVALLLVVPGRRHGPALDGVRRAGGRRRHEDTSTVRACGASGIESSRMRAAAAQTASVMNL